MRPVADTIPTHLATRTVKTNAATHPKCEWIVGIVEREAASGAAFLLDAPRPKNKMAVNAV
jgi:hypothetical protein